MTKEDKATIIRAVGFLAEGESLLFRAIKAYVTKNPNEFSEAEVEEWRIEAIQLNDLLIKWYEEDSE